MGRPGLIGEQGVLGRCRGCRWWCPLVGAHAGEGECRRFPPVLQPTCDGDRRGERGRSRWPLSGADDWCGEFAQVRRE